MRIDPRMLRTAFMSTRHKTTKNRKGQQWYMQTVVISNTASDANQKITKTVFHLNPKMHG